MDKQLILVVPPQNKNWVLDTTAKEIIKRYAGPASIAYSYDFLPANATVFVMHYSLLPVIFNLNPALKNVGVYFTHESLPVSSLIKHLNRCTSIIVSNDTTLHSLSSKGVNPRIINVVPESACPDTFKPHRRLERSVLISHGYYPRKNPDLILAVIKAMPERQFILLGKNWNQYEKFKELEELPNLTVMQDIPYNEYPAIYNECDVYFSASVLEGGGPHSLIEAMMTNMVPVVSRTGNYREYITHTYNGLHFDIKDKLSTITTMIDIAFALDSNISKTVQGFTWEIFVKEILESLSLVPITEKQS